MNITWEMVEPRFSPTIHKSEGKTVFTVRMDRTGYCVDSLEEGDAIDLMKRLTGHPHPILEKVKQ